QRRQDRRLRGGVVALDVCGRVGLGVTQAGGLGQHLAVIGAGGVHGVEDEVGGAVDDADDLVHRVARQRAAQRADDRDGGGDGGLEEEVGPGRIGGVGQLGAVGGDEE